MADSSTNYSRNPKSLVLRVLMGVLAPVALLVVIEKFFAIGGRTNDAHLSLIVNSIGAVLMICLGSFISQSGRHRWQNLRGSADVDQLRIPDHGNLEFRRVHQVKLCEIPPGEFSFDRSDSTWSRTSCRG